MKRLEKKRAKYLVGNKMNKGVMRRGKGIGKARDGKRFMSRWWEGGESNREMGEGMGKEREGREKEK